MKKCFLIFLVIVFSYGLSAQTYEKYKQQGEYYFNNKDYLTSLERFDLAYEVAKSNDQKVEARNWKNKCKLEIRRQQENLMASITRADSLLKISEERYKNINLILAKLIPGIGDNKDNVSKFIERSADSLYFKGNYKRAIEWYNLALLSSKNAKNKNILEKVKNANRCIRFKENGLNYFYLMKLNVAKLYFDSLLVINDKNIYAQRLLDYCKSPEERINFFIKSKTNDSLNVKINKYLTSNIEIVRFLNEYDGFFLQKGKYKGKRFIKSKDIYYENGIYKIIPGKELEPVISISWYGAKEFCSHYNLKLLKRTEIEKNIKVLDKKEYSEWCAEEANFQDNLYSNCIGRMWFYNPLYIMEHVSFRYAVKH